MSFYLMKPLEEAREISIIGGADGPTAIFIASKIKPLEEASAAGIIGGADAQTAIFITSNMNPNRIYTFVMVCMLCVLIAIRKLKKSSAVK